MQVLEHEPVLKQQGRVCGSWAVTPSPPFGGWLSWSLRASLAGAPQSPELPPLSAPGLSQVQDVHSHFFLAFVRKVFVHFSLPLAADIHIPTFFFVSLVPVFSNEM